MPRSTNVSVKAAPHNRHATAAITPPGSLLFEPVDLIMAGRRTQANLAVDHSGTGAE
jgi:hypothetical protein